MAQCPLNAAPSGFDQNCSKKSIFEGYGEFFGAYTNSVDPDGQIDAKIRPVPQLVRAQ